MPGFSDYFSEVAARYAAFRPTYPPPLVAYLRQITRGDTAWDIGCGSGQLTLALAGAFERVIATDPSSAQLAEAPAHPRVEYRVSRAEASGLADGSIDLAVAAQAAHWFDWPSFTAEIDRVTHAGSTIALVGYGNSRVGEASPEAGRREDGETGRVVTEFVEQIVGPYWPPERAIINNQYRELVLPYTRLEPPAIEMAVAWTRDEFLGYASSWSATHRMRAAVGGEAFVAFCERLAALWPDGERRRVCWPLLLVVYQR